MTKFSKIKLITLLGLTSVNLMAGQMSMEIPVIKSVQIANEKITRVPTTKQECYDEVSEKSNGSNIVSTVIGGALGGAAGSQFGQGSGKTAATIAGALIGSSVFNNMNGNSGSTKTVETKCKNVTSYTDEVSVNYTYKLYGELNGKTIIKESPYDSKTMTINISY